MQLARHERGTLAFRRVGEATQVESTARGRVCAGIRHGRLPACNAVDDNAQARKQVAMRQIRVRCPGECVGHDPAYRAAISPIDPSRSETDRGSGDASAQPRRMSLSASSQVVPGSRRSQLSRKHEVHSFQVSPANTARPTRPKCSANSVEEPSIPIVTETIALVDCGRISPDQVATSTNLMSPAALIEQGPLVGKQRGAAKSGDADPIPSASRNAAKP